MGAINLGVLRHGRGNLALVVRTQGDAAATEQLDKRNRAMVEAVC